MSPAPPSLRGAAFWRRSNPVPECIGNGIASPPSMAARNDVGGWLFIKCRLKDHQGLGYGNTHFRAVALSEVRSPDFSLPLFCFCYLLLSLFLLEASRCMVKSIRRKS